MATIESKGQFFTKGIDSHDESIRIANWNAVVSRVGSYTLVTLNVQQIRSAAVQCCTILLQISKMVLCVLMKDRSNNELFKISTFSS